MSKNDGGPAFASTSSRKDFYGREVGHIERGMTRRQYYVGQIIAGFCANTSIFQANDQNGWELTNCSYVDLADKAIDIADAIIERESK